MVTNFGYNISPSGIDLAEVSSIKKMIFQRAREKSETQNQSVQNDVMAEARSSINSDKPRLFGGLTASKTELTQTEQNNEKIETKLSDNSSKQPTEYETDLRQSLQPSLAQNVNPNPTNEKKSNPRQLKHNIDSVQESTYTNSMRDEIMKSAVNGYKKSSLEDSLRFLNTQAAISLVNKTHSKIV